MFSKENSLRQFPVPSNKYESRRSQEESPLLLLLESYEVHGSGYYCTAMMTDVAVPSRLQQGAILVLAAALVAAGVGGGQWFMDSDYVTYGVSVSLLSACHDDGGWLCYIICHSFGIVRTAVATCRCVRARGKAGDGRLRILFLRVAVVHSRDKQLHFPNALLLPNAQLLLRAACKETSLANSRHSSRSRSSSSSRSSSR